MIERQPALPLRRVVALVAFRDEHRPDLLLEKLDAFIRRLRPANDRATGDQKRNKLKEMGAAHRWKA